MEGKLLEHRPRLVRAAPVATLALVLSSCAATPDGDAIVLHGAYGSARDVLVEGRVGEAFARVEHDVADTPRLNLRRNAALFVTEECERCPIELALADGTSAGSVTDDEGFFRAELAPRTDVRDGWLPIAARSGDATLVGSALIVPPDNRLGLVSDIDDTVLVTEVADRFRMLGNTFFKNPLQREAVPGTARLYARVLAANPRPAATALFYLSSSPRELHGYLSGFLAANGFPRGVLLTRRLTFDRAGYLQLDPVRYKTARLVDVLERLPHVRFVLVGDDGEHDPEIYDAVRRRYPERVAGIWIRRVEPDATAPLPPGQTDLARVLAGEVRLPSVPSPSPLAPDP